MTAAELADLRCFRSVHPLDDYARFRLRRRTHENKIQQGIRRAQIRVVADLEGGGMAGSPVRQGLGSRSADQCAKRIQN